MNDMHSFSTAKQLAIEQMLDMNKKASQTGTLPRRNAEQKTHKELKNSLNGSRPEISYDAILIIGLILILSEDCHDMWLFLALLYVLM